MIWNLTDQRTVDLRVLWALFIGADQDKPVQSLENLESTLSSHGASKMRVAHALDNLVAANCIAKGEHGYYITAHGVDWVEDTFEYVKKSKTNYMFYLKHEKNVLGVLQSKLKSKRATKQAPIQAANWTRIGAVAAIVAIPVAIALWWLS